MNFKDQKFKNTIYNLIASFIPLFILELLIIPIVASKISSDSYGALGTIIAVVNLISYTFGIAINNVRLVNQNRFKADDDGSFNIVALFMSLILSVIVYFVFKILNLELSSADFIILMVFSFISSIGGYIVVEYRISLDYKKIMINEFFRTLGYSLGFLIFYFTERWVFIYFFGYIFSFLYLLYNTKRKYFEIKITENFYKIIGLIFLLYLSILMSKIPDYIDKIIIYPSLGGEQVSIYLIAMKIPKFVSMFITPLSAVLLSYISKKESVSNKNFIKIISVTFLVNILFYIIIIIGSPILLKILYPQYHLEASKLIKLSSIDIVLSIVYQIINIFIVSFKKLKYNLGINVIYSVLYTFLAIGLVTKHGIYGMIIIAIIVKVFRIVLSILVYIFTENIEKTKEKELKIE